MALENNRNPMYLNKYATNGFFSLTISDLLLMFNRQYYTVALQQTGTENGLPIYVPVLSIWYTFLLCCLYPLQSILDDFNTFRLKAYNLAATPWAAASVTAYLNYYYDNINNSIFLNYKAPVQANFISSKVTNKPVWLSSKMTNNPIWLSSHTADFVSLFNLQVNVPASLIADIPKYTALQADLRTLVPAGIYYEIIPIP